MATTKWILDPAHSEITFRVRHMMISNVKGAFTKFDASINGEDFTKSTIGANIDANSLTTNATDRDTHLRSADFFEVEKHPEKTW